MIYVSSMEHPITITSKGKITKSNRGWWRTLAKKAKQQIMEQEDQEIFKILDNIAKVE